MCNQTAFGGMLQGIVELASIVLRPEPLDTEIERRCKRAWDEAPCPDCGETAVQTRDDSPRVWCSSCRYVFTYTLRPVLLNSARSEAMHYRLIR
jgi:protein-arginine kinase activator protein McsA